MDRQTMLFRDRIAAGRLLASALKEFENDKNAIVIALPRGGVPVGYEVAKALNLPLDIVSPRKIGAPFNPEYAIGAITETGEGIFDNFAIAQLGVSKDYIDEQVQVEIRRAQERLKLYRNDKPPRNVKGKTVILVDDGLATGSTMKAAIISMKSESASKIVVAVPVAPKDTASEIERMVDQLVILQIPHLFYAVGQFYENFSQTTDEEVINLLNFFRK